MTSIPVFRRTEPAGLKPAGSTPMRSGIVLPAAFPDTMWLVDGNEGTFMTAQTARGFSCGRRRPARSYGPGKSCLFSDSVVAVE